MATTSHDFLNLSSGEPDDTLTDADFTTLEALLDNFFNTLKPQRASSTAITAYRWYRVGPGIVPPNPAVRVTIRNNAGSVGAMAPPQLAISVTEKTPIRREWGRFYLPSITESSIDTSTGRISGTVVASIAQAAGDLYSGASAGEFPAVVYSPTRQKAYTVEQVQVDDLFDVIRSRRWDKPTLRVVKP